MVTQPLKTASLTEHPSSSNNLGMLPSGDHPSSSLVCVPIDTYEYDDYREITIGWHDEEDEAGAGSVSVNEDDVLSSLDHALAICADIGVADTLHGKNSPLQTAAQGGNSAPAVEDGETADAQNQ